MAYSPDSNKRHKQVGWEERQEHGNVDLDDFKLNLHSLNQSLLPNGGGLVPLLLLATRGDGSS